MVPGIEPHQYIVAATLLALVLGLSFSHHAAAILRNRKLAADVKREALLAGTWQPHAPPPHLCEADSRRYTRLAHRHLSTIAQLATTTDYFDRGDCDRDAIPFVSRHLTKMHLASLERRRLRLEAELRELAPPDHGQSPAANR